MFVYLLLQFCILYYFSTLPGANQMLPIDLLIYLCTLSGYFVRYTCSAVSHVATTHWIQVCKHGKNDVEVQTENHNGRKKDDLSAFVGVTELKLLIYWKFPHEHLWSFQKII